MALSRTFFLVPIEIRYSFPLPSVASAQTSPKLQERFFAGRTHMPNDPVIEVATLHQFSNVLLLDVREAEAFEKDHAAGAVRVPIEAWVEAAKRSETSFASTAFWERQIGELGVCAITTAVVVDDGRMTEAARVWFILQFFGAKAHILNGGWPVLSDAGIALPLPLETFTGRPFKAAPGSGEVGLVERDELKDELDGETTIFDARTRAEFDGKDLRSNARGGHLPGARLLSHADLLQGKQLKSPEDLHRLIDAAGFRPGEHVVTHCDGGGRAALAAVAAVRAGFPDVRVYYLSFSDWAKDESCPIISEL
ncbi:rhodanese-like domain-containing protein [Mesorhizobium sp. M0159]|uniref:sulfurtransferase n=1 Tax=unclassified Mesorhizobium TaxID=325217 RepID=UPI00333ACE6E